MSSAKAYCVAVLPQSRHQVADELDLEIIQNTLHNACKRTRHDFEDQGTSAPRPNVTAKRRCWFGSLTRVRVSGTTPADDAHVPIPADRLFARWGDDLERPSAPRPGSTCDFALQAKASDGPHLAARLTADLIKGVVKRTVTDAASILASLRASLAAAKLDVQALSSHHDLAILNAVYQRIGMLAERLQEDGKVGLLPTTVILDMTYLRILQNLQTAVRKLAVRCPAPGTWEPGATPGPTGHGTLNSGTAQFC